MTVLSHKVTFILCILFVNFLLCLSAFLILLECIFDKKLNFMPDLKVFLFSRRIYLSINSGLNFIFCNIFKRLLIVSKVTKEKTERTKKKKNETLKNEPENMIEESGPEVSQSSGNKPSFFKPALFKDIIALIFIFSGLFLLYCITNPPMSGNLGESAGLFLNDLLGLAAFIVPLLVLLLGLRFFYPFSLKAAVYYLAIIILAVCSAEVARFVFWGSDSYLGAAAGSLLIENIGRTATGILLAFLFIVSFILFSGVSIIDFSNSARKKLKDSQNGKKKISKDDSSGNIPVIAVSEEITPDTSVSEPILLTAESDKTYTESLPEVKNEEEESDEPLQPALSMPEDSLLPEELSEDESEYYREHQDEILNDFAGGESGYTVGDYQESSFESEDNLEIEEGSVNAALYPDDNESFEGKTAKNTKPAVFESKEFFNKEEPKADLVMVSQNYKYRLPPLSILTNPAPPVRKNPPKDYSGTLIETLESFGVTAKVCHIQRGPSVTRYELELGKGVKVSKITGLTNDISLVFASPVRIAPVPGKSYLGIEVPNDQIDTVSLKEMLASEEFRKSSWHIPVALGKDITGKTIVGDLTKMPHLLVAGSTGSGKSVCMNCLIASILYRAKPTEVQMVMIDPKKVELSVYEGIPHLVDIKATPEKKIITDPKIAALVLQQMAEIMDNRYNEFQRLHVRNIFEYNEKSAVTLPYLLIFIDELADLMMVSKGGVEQSICRLTQLGRAAGVHLIIATQRPSVDVITGLIKVNVPSRIAFAVASQVDSRTILDTMGAEKLLGKGDMLYLPGAAPDSKRVQGAFVDTDEIEKLVKFWHEQPPPENMQLIDIVSPSEANESENDENDSELDELYEEALRIILQERFASVSILQRKMKIGYARAGRIIDQMERKGVVGPANGSKPRKILVGAMAGDHFLHSN